MEPSSKRCYRRRRPGQVFKVMRAIQKIMTDEHQKKGRRPTTLPKVPKRFIYSEVVRTEDKKKMIDFVRLKQERCLCYKIFIPFSREKTLKSDEMYVWSEKLISFSRVSKEESCKDLVIVEVSNYSRTRRGKRKRFISKPFKNFGKSKLVGCYSGRNLISSHHMTISWLRSCLHKAINKYLQTKESNVEVIPVIKQKKEGPLFLSLQVRVERKDSDRESAQSKSEYVLFTLCPAFRVSSCHLVVPVVRHFDKIPAHLVGSAAEEFLWKRITECRNRASGHKHEEVKIIKQVELKEKKTSLNRQTGSPVSKKILCKDVKRNLTSPQRQQCQKCVNPASRMLLEYYYQYGNIPEEEMTHVNSFVERILEFIKHSIKRDRKSNDPKVLDFVKSGSVPEKLKVVQPNEFDVMVKIGLPESKINYNFYSDDSFPPGYAVCRVRQTGNVSYSLKRCLAKVDAFDVENCLNPEKLAFGWLYGMLERAINKFKNTSDSRKVRLKIKRGGPALMLQITRIYPKSEDLPLPDEIKVDLVLALEHSLERSSNDSRLYVPKRPRLEHIYKKKLKEMKLEQPDSDETPKPPTTEENMTMEKKPENAKKNLQYMWRISCSDKEKSYLEYVEEKQRERGVTGCQKICLKILKTICTREPLKHRESVVCHKLSSYILKTALFHVLKQTDLVRDWTMDCLANRYVDLLNKLSKLDKELPHFFFNNESYLAQFFPFDNDLGKTYKKSINLLDDLSSTLKIQLLKRFSRIANSFKNWKEEMDKRWKDPSVTMNDQAYHEILGEKCPEEIIHPSVKVSGEAQELQGDEDAKETEKKLKENQREDRQVKEAVKNERRSGIQLHSGRNLRRVQENEDENRGRKRKNEGTDDEDEDKFDQERNNFGISDMGSDQSDDEENTSVDENQDGSQDDDNLREGNSTNFICVEEDEDDYDIDETERYYSDDNYDNPDLESGNFGISPLRSDQSDGEEDTFEEEDQDASQDDDSLQEVIFIDDDDDDGYDDDGYDDINETKCYDDDCEDFEGCKRKTQGAYGDDDSFECFSGTGIFDADSDRFDGGEDTSEDDDQGAFEDEDNHQEDIFTGFNDVEEDEDDNDSYSYDDYEDYKVNGLNLGES